MSNINNEACDSLTNIMLSLLPEVAEEVQLTLTVNLLSIMPTGIGGFISLNEEPIGEIIGRQVEAIVGVHVRGEDVEDLDNPVSMVARSFIGGERKTLTELGVLNISFDEIGVRSKEKQGNKTVVEQDLKFKVLYEFLKRPEEAEDVIREIPINLQI